MAQKSHCLEVELVTKLQKFLQARDQAENRNVFLSPDKQQIIAKLEENVKFYATLLLEAYINAGFTVASAINGEAGEEEQPMPGPLEPDEDDLRNDDANLGGFGIPESQAQHAVGAVAVEPAGCFWPQGPMTTNKNCPTPKRTRNAVTSPGQPPVNRAQPENGQNGHGVDGQPEKESEVPNPKCPVQ